MLQNWNDLTLDYLYYWWHDSIFFSITWGKEIHG
jgi:hypothetical protein